MTYSLHTSAGSVSSAEIVAQLDRAIPIQAAHIESIRQLEANGMRYSNEDYDVLAAARRAVGRTDVKAYEAGWVARMAREAAAH